MTSKINWEQLEMEIHSVITHASAGSDFEADDIQVAVKGCIEEFKKALNKIHDGYPEVKR